MEDTHKSFSADELAAALNLSDRGLLEQIFIEVLQIKKTTNKMLDILTDFSVEYKRIKNQPGPDDNKILMLADELDKVNGYLHEDALNTFVAISQQNCNHWSEYDALTRKYIPLSYYLSDKLHALPNSDDIDYSPVILELCRAIENECLKKIFVKYTNDLCSRYQSKTELKHYLNREFSINNDGRKNKKPTYLFSSAILDCYDSQCSYKYTLGAMSRILKMLNDDSLVSRSQLLQDFKKYLKRETIYSALLDADYLDNLDKIVNDYRNKSAHPNIMSKDIAIECQNGMPETIDYLIDCILSEK